MERLLDIVIWAHVAAGFVGLGAFWIPIFARKGGVSHVRFGRVYAWCAYFVTVSAVTASIGRVVGYQAQGITMAERPELYGFAFFLGYLGVATFAAVRQSIRAVQTRRQPEKLRTPFHLALAYTSIAGSIGVIAFAIAAWSDASIILLSLSPVGILTGRRMLGLMRNPGAEHMGWFYSHMGSMIGGGVAFHTAFAVFGAQRFWDYELAGLLGVLPWILPAAIGIPGLILAEAHYRRKFSRTAPAPTATVTARSATVKA